MESGRPYISVIIPALNEENYIMHPLKGLQAQLSGDFEIIVVDGKSSDGTMRMAKGIANKVIEEAASGVSAARNAGAHEASGDVLLFLDADTRPGSGLISVYSKAFKESGIAAATGPIMPLEKSAVPMRVGYFIVSVLFVRLSILLGRPTIIGSNFAVRRSVFEKSGGFDKSMVTYEDWDLSQRLRKYGAVRYLGSAGVQTSTRRIKEWGIYGFFKFYMGNIVRYNLFKKPKANYGPVR